MSLSVGIVGLPNVGKSTLFNALLKKQQAYAANFPFATIEPNVGVVPVPDKKLSVLAKAVKETENLTKLPPEVPATVEFVDIAGLIAGASKGEGLGNKFLAHIREVDAICHVVRVFSDENVAREGSSNPISDLGVIKTELQLADLQTLEKQKESRDATDKEDVARWATVVKLKNALEKGISAREVNLNEEELKVAKELSLLTLKPAIIALNVSEEDLASSPELEKKYSKKFSVELDQVVVISAKVEADLAGLTPDDEKEYLSDLGVNKSGLERLIKKAFSTLGLITFLTAGEKEVRAWTIKEGISAREAAGVIHTDFEKKFIKADTCDYAEFINLGWKRARDEGKVRSEGKGYIVKNGDVIEFKVGA